MLDSGRMFERFTNRARHVIVLAQDEATRLQHNYIGTEHLLLGLLGEPEGMAARALGRFGMSLPQARQEVLARVGQGKARPSGRIPFTPRAKKVLELGLREALALHHNYIGTEHLLLGLVREGDGAGARIVAAHADAAAVRQAVLDVVSSAPAARGRRWRRRSEQQADQPAAAAEAKEIRTTPAADDGLDAAARLAGSGPVGSHHLLLAMLTDPSTAAARALAAAGLDLDRAKEALRKAEVAGTSDEEPDEAGRRQMIIRVAEDRLTLEVTEETIVGLGRAALAALGGQPGDPAESSGDPTEGSGDPAEGSGRTDTIRGDLPVSASLGAVWQALKDSLEDIARQAAAPVARHSTE
jgi:ATP-dependent Clp protease ATP-binding subunit ClpA